MAGKRRMKGGANCRKKKSGNEPKQHRRTIKVRAQRHKRPGDSNPAMPDRDVPDRVGGWLSYQQKRHASLHAQVAMDKALAS